MLRSYKVITKRHLRSFVIDLCLFLRFFSDHGLLLQSALLFMLLLRRIRPQALSYCCPALMTHQHSNGVATGTDHSNFEGATLAELPKSNIFTQNLPADANFPSPASSFKARRKELGPRLVQGALYTYVKPEEKERSELYGVSERAMRDIGLKPTEEQTADFQKLVSGNKIMWDPETEKGIYPWAQCYGGG